MRAAKFEFNTWDDAFGKIPAKGTYRVRIRGIVEYAIAVGKRIRDLKSKGQGIGDPLFGELAEHFGIAEERVKKYWDFFKQLERMELNP
jgi:hypothetical protein